MQASTGDLYKDRNKALEAGVPPEDIVEISGPPAAVSRVSEAVRFARAKKRRKTQRASRRRNR